MSSEGEILRRKIKSSTMTVQEIAAKIGITRGQLYNLCNKNIVAEHHKVQLKKIGIEIDQNYMVSEPYEKYGDNNLEYQKLKIENQFLKQQIGILEEMIKYLKKQKS